MLKTIKINNVALIKELIVEFDTGLNVMSGETGAGKSIIIESLNFVLGGKPNKNLIRSACDSMRVEAVFSAPFSELVKVALIDNGIEYEDDIILSRTLNIANRSEIRINGHMATISMLKSISSLLVDIHGQHEHQSLLKEKEHIKLLDNYMPINISRYKSELADLLSRYNELVRKIDSLGSNASNRERMLDLIKYQIDEIENFGLGEDEEEELVSKRDRFVNSEKISNALISTYNSLGGDSNVLLTNLKNAENELKYASKYSSEFESWAERIASARIELDDIMSSIGEFRDNFSFDQNELDRIEMRLDGIKALHKKYGATYQDIMAYLDKLTSDYDSLIDSEAMLNKLSNEKAVVWNKMVEVSKQLSQERHSLATMLEGKVMSELDELGMKNAKFEVQFDDVEDYSEDALTITSNGYDELRFLFSANAGQALKPLSDIISGGEMSRFMLAIKNIIVDRDQIGTIVFDEIDTGISGHIGFVIACKMSNISKSHQVIAVSHLPQISAMADNRYLIAKYTRDNNTYTEINKLTQEEGVAEVARLSGGENSDTSLSHARELIDRCIRYKNS